MAKKAVPDPVAVSEPAWEPPKDHLVLDSRERAVSVDGVTYEHVSEAPDGRWVYRVTRV